jgi:hypothetical protein
MQLCAFQVLSTQLRAERAASAAAAGTASAAAASAAAASAVVASAVVAAAAIAAAVAAAANAQLQHADAGLAVPRRVGEAALVSQRPAPASESSKPLCSLGHTCMRCSQGCRRRASARAHSRGSSGRALVTQRHVDALHDGAR